jgi:hypothetical protein
MTSSVGPSPGRGVEGRDQIVLGPDLDRLDLDPDLTGGGLEVAHDQILHVSRQS